MRGPALTFPLKATAWRVSHRRAKGEVELMAPPPVPPPPIAGLSGAAKRLDFAMALIHSGAVSRPCN
jgi:hypothetical protein